MPHTSKIEEKNKMARETKFATLGRAIADAASRGDSVDHLIEEVALRRWQEQQQTDKATAFAALEHFSHRCTPYPENLNHA